MDRDELLRVTAKRYAEAQLNLEQADKDASSAKMRADNARIERDRITEELRQFVGRHQPRRLVLIPDTTRAVMIDLDLRDTVHEKVYVSLQAVL